MAGQQPETGSPDLASVWSFLKDRQLKETEQALRRELGMEGVSQTGVLTPHLPPVSQSDTEPVKYKESYSSLLAFVERSLDMYRSELSLLLYPVFVHLYLDLVRAGHSQEAQLFFALYRSKQESFYEEELLRLKSITSPLHMNSNEIVELFTNGKFTIRMSSDSFQCLEKHLQVKNETLILRIIQKFLNLDGTVKHIIP
jgi:transcription initiation factor TFIID subunit 5